MSHIKDRLTYYNDFMKKLADYHQMIPASDVLKIIEELQDDLEQDEKENGWIPVSDMPNCCGYPVLLTVPRDKEVRKIYTFTIPRESFDELNPDKQLIRQLISKHISKVDRLKKNMSYYEGKHKILDETNRDNRLVCNHAKDISDTASSYFIGNPVTYKSERDIKPLTDALELAGADETDGDNGLEASIYGLAYEYVYVKENENNLQTKNL